MIRNLGIIVSVQDYVEIKDHEKIHEEQNAPIKAKAEPAEVERDEDQAPVSAKEALRCYLLLRSHFVSSYRDVHIVQSDMDEMSSGIRKNRQARSKQLDMSDFIQ